jgi:hypothetical protein
MKDSSNDNQSKEELQKTKFVKRLIEVPEVIWNEHFIRLLKIFGLPFQKAEFDIYKYIDLVPFIANATNAFRTALIGHALNFVGIKITFDNGSKNGERVEGQDFTFKVTIDKDREIYAIETIKALSRNYENKNVYHKVVESTSQEDRDYLEKIRTMDPAVRNENTIVDVKGRNNIE